MKKSGDELYVKCKSYDNLLNSCILKSEVDKLDMDKLKTVSLD